MTQAEAQEGGSAFAQLLTLEPSFDQAYQTVPVLTLWQLANTIPSEQHCRSKC